MFEVCYNVVRCDTVMMKSDLGFCYYKCLVVIGADAFGNLRLNFTFRYSFRCEKQCLVQKAGNQSST